MDILQSLENEKVETQVFIERAELLKLLRNNRAFKKLIITDYIENETKRLTSLIPVTYGEQKERVLIELESVARFNHYLSIIEQMGHMATNKIAEIEKSIEEEIQDRSESETEVSDEV